MSLLNYLGMLLLTCGCLGWHTHPPRNIEDQQAAEWYICLRLIAMNNLLVKDTELKARHAQKLQERYKGTLAYELGTITATIIDLYKYILEVYKKYCDFEDFRKYKFPSYEIFNSYHVIRIKCSYGEIPDITPLFPYMSEKLYFSLSNESKDEIWSSSRKEKNDYEALKLEDMEKIQRRWSVQSENYYGIRHYTTKGLTHRACSFLGITYRSLMKDIKRYYKIRYLYVHNVEYEIGYLCHQVIHRYQMMIEVYHIVIHRFVNHPDRRFVWPNLMFYLYTNMLEYGTVIGHLCNMIHEIESKFEALEPLTGVFDDEMSRTRDRKKRTGGRPSRPSIEPEENIKAIENYEHKIEERKREERKEKKKRKKQLEKGLTVATTVSRKKKKRWPLHYGWSIENW